MDAASLQRLVSEVAVRELGEDERTREHALTLMRDWVTSHPNIRNCRTDDIFLLRFLRVKKFDIPMAQQMLLHFLNIRNLISPHLVCGLDVNTPSINELISLGFYFASPYRDNYGRQVIILNIAKLDPKRFSCDTPLQVMQLCNYAVMENDITQVLGLTFVFDFSQLSLGHFRLWSSPFEILRFLNNSGEKAVPLRVKELHFIMPSTIALWIINLVKVTLSKKLRERIKIHNTLEDLHKKVNPAVLPTEYGGTTQSEEMIDLWKKELVSKRDIILNLDNMKLFCDKGTKAFQSKTNTDTDTSFSNLQVD